jgi:hypothetical protein
MESIRVKGANERDAILVDEHEKGVWLHMYVSNGSMYVTLTKEQTQELIAALQQVIA